MLRVLLVLSFLTFGHLQAQSFEAGFGMGKLIFLDVDNSNSSMSAIRTFSRNVVLGYNFRTKSDKGRIAKINLFYSDYKGYVNGYYSHHSGAGSKQIGAYVTKQIISANYYPGLFCGHTDKVDFGFGFSLTGTFCKYSQGQVHVKNCNGGLGCKDTFYNFYESNYSTIYYLPVNFGLVYNISIQLLKKDKEQLRLMVHSASNVFCEYYFHDAGLRMYRMNFNLIFRHEL